MKLAIVGSRDLTELDRIYQFMISLPKDTIIVSGGAIGVDQVAEICAKRLNLGTKIFKPNYDEYDGSLAPLIRNKQIVDYADVIVAFWDGKSRGTKYTIDYAIKRKKKVTMVRCK